MLFRSAMIDMAGDEGTLAHHEKALYRNILRLDEIRVKDVMTPHTVLVDMWQESTVEDLLAENRRGKLPSRIPLYGKSRDEVSGYILLREILTAALADRNHSTPLSAFRRDIRFIPELATLRKTLDDLISGQDPIAMVADELGGTCGVVTTEDVFETILSIEVVDEKDRFEDLQSHAQELRDKRIERLIRERRFLSNEDEDKGGS